MQIFVQHAKKGFICLKKCNQYCLKCTEDKCLTCKQDYFLTQGQKCVKCDQERQFQENGQCKECDPSCLKCNGTGKTNCTQCKLSLFLSQKYLLQIFINEFYLQLFQQSQYKQ
ncbi:zinc finger, lsd1 subclass family protein, putative (macronuclear) [Tetrahymena thermophila SB210]|uniref:Zinc finger, lsd1 subclass family protein, putative n=1 Tax=Tetrahymena thermophila (strain SB210) TaxID=312017 RepID=Q234X0_TETTS|nr:zinc finger, lsd1 subclass family protein, putative [Tetrahymena thermophila SB210]EAR91883.4 zinc finger, lsd1 subclass family protein, putative [Tetrahymena thermophila SB210]|eukprot:XP_001012128.4 zinc finger, lsd1 subclass family protein, putative [Tetrahymena thermophila SB210]